VFRLARVRVAMAVALLAPVAALSAGNACSSEGAAGSGGDGAGWPNTPGGNCGDFDASVDLNMAFPPCDSGAADDTACVAWGKTVLPPQWAWQGACLFPEEYCAVGPLASAEKHCFLGPEGDSFCSAWYEGWVRGSGTAAAKCVEHCLDGQASGTCPTRCEFDCAGQPSPQCGSGDAILICVQRGDGAPRCEVPCQ
jgi:hypothetical protein